MKIRYSRATSDGAMYKNGVLGVKNGRFDAAADGKELDLTQYLVCPGFIDMHTHGGAGIDSMKTDAEGLSQLSMHYASCGVAVFHPTTVTATLDDMLRAIEMTKAAMQTGTRGACINGIYLEGPYLSAKYRGAHEEALLRDPDMAELDRLLAAADGIIRVVTIAPERAGALAAISHLRAHGVRAQVYAEQKKFKAKLSYADKLKIPYAVFLGEDELAQGVVKVKDLTSGEQLALAPEAAAAHISAGIAARSEGKPIREKA